MTLRVAANRQKIYLGESVLIQVSAAGTRDGANIPVFPDNSAVEFISSRDESRRSTISINGKVTVDSYEGRAFIYRATPQAAGIFDTGPAILSTHSGTIRAPGVKVEVAGVEARSDVSVRVECEKESVLVDEPFTVRLTISVREPLKSIEPLFPGRAPHIDAAFLDNEVAAGLDRAEPNAILGRFVQNSGFSPFASFSSTPAFTIDSYADTFGRAIEFRVPARRVERDGATFCEYSIDAAFTPKAEGTYTFGPVTMKGPIITAVNERMEATLDNVFVVGPAVTVRVEPPPEADRPEWFSGSVGKSMRAKASFDTARCKVGDPLTLTIDIDGEFSLSNLRPPILSLQPDVSESFRLYDDNVESEPIENGRRFKYRVRPVEAGTLEFPPVRVAYYDTERREYVTVATDPMPLQVEETTRISASSATAYGEGDDAFSGAYLVPDGMLHDKEDATPLLSRNSRFRAAIVAAPILWLLCILSAPIAALSRRVAAAVRERSSRSSAGMEKALRMARSNPSAAASMAIGAARGVISARLGLRTASPSAGEMADALSARGADAAATRELLDAFSDLERLSYSPGGANADSVEGATRRLLNAVEAATRRIAPVVAALLAAILGALPQHAEAMPAAPSAFEWERAENVAASASSAEDFLDAARIYFGMIESGKDSGPLRYNLGVALLLAGEKGAALEAFRAAERLMGTTPEIANSMRAALSEEGARANLPASRVFLAWHYGVPLAARTDAAGAAWVTFWIAAAILVLIRGRAGIARGALRTIAAIALAVLATCVASVAVTRLQERAEDYPRIKTALATPSALSRDVPVARDQPTTTPDGGGAVATPSTLPRDASQEVAE